MHSAGGQPPSGELGTAALAPASGLRRQQDILRRGPAVGNRQALRVHRIMVATAAQALATANRPQGVEEEE